MRDDDTQSLAWGLLAASRALVDGISAGVRPADSQTFARFTASPSPG